MKILIAPDSFKGSLTARQVSSFLAEGIREVMPRADIQEIPLSDGGEGFAESLLAANPGYSRTLPVKGPAGKIINSSLHFIEQGQTAVIEMASASGLTLIPENRRNPLDTTTYGTGELIKAALEEDTRKILVGLGGSATCDGGSGALAALGIRFLNQKGQSIPLTGGGLGRLASIDTSGLDPRLQNCRIRVACDVANPLLGHSGTARIYAPQKGASAHDVEFLERNLSRYHQLVMQCCNRDLASRPGAGAAGGLAYGLAAFLGAELESGIQLVINYTGFRQAVEIADLIITGEGSLDRQTMNGKTVWGVLEETGKTNAAVILVAGFTSVRDSFLNLKGVKEVFSLAVMPADIPSAMANAPERLKESGRKIAEQIKSGKIQGDIK